MPSHYISLNIRKVYIYFALKVLSCKPKVEYSTGVCRILYLFAATYQLSIEIVSGIKGGKNTEKKVRLKRSRN